MSASHAEYDVFHSVRLGDSLWNIAANQVPGSSQKEISKELNRIFLLNPQIKDPNRISVNDLIRLATPGIFRSQISAPSFDLNDMQTIWKRTSPHTKETIHKNFDLLDWLSERLDEMDFLNGSTEQTASLWKAVQPYATSIEKAELIKLSRVYERLVVVRDETVLLLNRLRISVTRMPIFIISVRPNGLYSYAQKLVRMIELAEKFRLGKILIAGSIAIEAAKVAHVAVATRNLNETGRKAAKGVGKIGGGALGAAGAKYGCQTLIRIGGWYGAGGCVLLVGLGIWKGQSFGEKAGEVLYNLVLPPEKLSDLP